MAAPTTRTLLQIQQDILSRLSENANSTIAALPNGADGTLTEDAATAIRRYVNEGARILARAAYPIHGTGTFAAPAGASFVAFNRFDCGDGSGLWAVRKLTVGGAAAYRASRSYAEINTTSGKQMWSPDGASGVQLTPALSAGATLSAVGFVVPPAKALDSDTFDWLEPDLDYLLVEYALGEVCAKIKAQDEVLGALAPYWSGRFREGVLMQSARLKASDPALWAAHFAYPLGSSLSGGGK